MTIQHHGSNPNRYTGLPSTSCDYFKNIFARGKVVANGYKFRSING